MMSDEIRRLFNYEPLPDGAGQRAPIRGEYHFATDDRDRLILDDDTMKGSDDHAAK